MVKYKIVLVILNALQTQNTSKHKVISDIVFILDKLSLRNSLNLGYSSILDILHLRLPKDHFSWSINLPLSDLRNL